MPIETLWNAAVVFAWIAAAEYALGAALLSVVAFRYLRRKYLVRTKQRRRTD